MMKLFIHVQAINMESSLISIIGVLLTQIW